MDSARFGRALGFGARSAVRALAGAVDAAAAPSPARHPPVAPPAPSQRPETVPAPVAPAPVASAPRPSVASMASRATVRTGAHARNTGKGLTRGGKRFGDAVWGPFARLSTVLWLEITGSFFGIFALFAGSAAWAHRADIHATATNRDARLHLLVFVGMSLAFGYFCVSSFLRAYRR